MASEIKKYFSESNMIKVINTIIGICGTNSENIETLKEQCIGDYSEDVLYRKNNIVIYNNNFYRAKTSYQGAWDDTKFTLLDDSFTELSTDDIKGFLNLSTEELNNLQNLINDAQVTLNKTYSSSKIYTELQNVLDLSKQYTLQELSNISKASYKVVSTTTEMTEECYIYLMSNGTNYDLYIVEEANDTPVQIGNMDIDLSQYYTKTEIDDTFLTKSDATVTYATKTEMEEKVDKTDIVTTLNETATDNQVASAKVVYDNTIGKIVQDLASPSSNTLLSTEGLQSVMEGKADVDDVLTKDQLATSITTTSTNEEVATAKAVLDYSYGVEIATTEALELYGNNPLTYPLGTYRFPSSAFTRSNIINLPKDETAGILTIESIRPNKVITGAYCYRIYTFDSYIGRTYIRKAHTGENTDTTFATDTGWKALATVAVTVKDEEDVNVTSSLDTSKAIAGSIQYSVKNGICFVRINGLRVLCACNEAVILPSNILPKASSNSYFANISTWESTDVSTILLLPNVSGGLNLWCKSSALDKSHYGSFSYPVAE